MNLKEYKDKPLRIACLSELLSIEIDESCEDLAEVSLLAPSVLLRPMALDQSPVPKALLLRTEACLRLEQAAISLRAVGIQMVLADAWRPPSLQEKTFDEFKATLSTQRTWDNEQDLLEAVHQFIAYPPVAGHPTGGAVDVWLADAKLNPIDVGSTIWDFNKVELLPTFSPICSVAQLANRLLLRAAMLDAGFAPFDGEWWHFSYGDREWAALSERQALYAPYSPSS